MSEIVITAVTPALVPRLEAALQSLAAHLSDPYATDLARLEAAVCGPQAPCLALLALRDETTLGALLAAPVFSTKLGGAGLFVSDLWVATGARGRGLARRLLARALDEAARRDAGHFLKLAAYHDNPRALAAYKSLGFVAQMDEAAMVLTGAALEALRDA